MCHTRAPSAARRARAREWRDGLGLDCDRGRAEPRFRRFACSSDVGRHASRTRPVHGPVRPNSRYTSVYPKNALPGVWRARVLNTAARSALGFTMIESQSVGLRLRGRYTCVRQTGLRGQRRRVRIFYPPAPRARPIPRPCARVAAGAHTPTRHAPLRCGPQTPRV